MTSARRTAVFVFVFGLVRKNARNKTLWRRKTRATEFLVTAGIVVVPPCGGRPLLPREKPCDRVSLDDGVFHPSPRPYLASYEKMLQIKVDDLVEFYTVSEFQIIAGNIV